jgi:hypothetical protein
MIDSGLQKLPYASMTVHENVKRLKPSRDHFLTRYFYRPKRWLAHKSKAALGH